MNVIQFIMGNWDFILLIVLAALALIWAIFKGNKSSRGVCARYLLFFVRYRSWRK